MLHELLINWILVAIVDVLPYAAIHQNVIAFGGAVEKCQVFERVLVIVDSDRLRWGEGVLRLDPGVSGWVQLGKWIQVVVADVYGLLSLHAPINLLPCVIDDLLSS